MAAIPFLGLYYNFFDKGVLGIIFSSVNKSPWELMKPLFWVCLVWWSFELLWGVKKFKIFVKAKVICLLLLCIFSCGVNILLLYFLPDIMWCQPLLSAALAYCFYFISNIAEKNMDKTDGFGLCIFILAVMIGAVFCFSVFPPRNFLFLDKFFNTYGILD